MSARSDILIFILEKGCTFEPVCDVSELGKRIFVEIEVTELDLNHLSVNIIDGYKIEISGRKSKNTSKEAVYLRAERMFGSFTKRLELPCSIDRVEDISYSGGLLKVTLVKKE